MTRFLAFAGLLFLAHPVAAQDTVVVDGQTLKTVGTVIGVESADVPRAGRLCLLTLKDDKGETFTAHAAYEYCTPDLFEQRVRLIYRAADIPAESCQGDPNCRKFDSFFVVVSVGKP
jgi:hypothetical protein